MLRNRAAAAAAFRTDAKAAIETYHNDVERVWRRWGRPSMSALCSMELNYAWTQFKERIRAASDKMNNALGVQHEGQEQRVA